MKKKKMNSLFLAAAAAFLAFAALYAYMNMKQTPVTTEYPRQTEDRCVQGGAQWAEFRTGCHDECTIARSTEPVRCTQALSYGCDCGPGACWNGTACEPD